MCSFISIFEDMLIQVAALNTVPSDVVPSDYYAETIKRITKVTHYYRTSALPCIHIIYVIYFRKLIQKSALI